MNIPSKNFFIISVSTSLLAITSYFIYNSICKKTVQEDKCKSEPEPEIIENTEKELCNQDYIDHYGDEIDILNSKIQEMEEDVKRVKQEHSDLLQAKKNNTSFDMKFDELTIENRNNLYIKKKKIFKDFKKEANNQIENFNKKISDLKNII